jgi:hypothetical protein
MSVEEVVEYSFGAIPDRPDPRDYQFSSLVDLPRAKLVQATDRKLYSMVNKDFRINQGNEGTCVTHSKTNVLLAGLSTHPDYPDFQTVELAHQFARKMYVESSGDTTYKQGMYPRDACAWMKANGFVDSYWKVESVEDVITALLTFGPVTVAIPWYSSMFGPDNRLGDKYGNYWIKVNLESEHVGYHDIAFTAVDLSPDDGAPAWLRVQNSWVPWGLNSTGRLTVESFRRLNIWDNWTFAEKPF